MLIMTLRWDVDDVENAIVIMYVVYVHGGGVTLLDIPGGRNIVVKEYLWKGDDLESLIIHGQCIDGANVSYFILHENSMKFVSKYL